MLDAVYERWSDLLLVRRLNSTLVLAGLLFIPVFKPSAQVLARPGWAGSGVVSEPWWRSAVVYLLDPARFQDSVGKGRGDLPGVTQRLEYLESLGVDALLLDGASVADEGFDDLLRGASQHHLRLLLTVTPAMQTGDPQALLQRVHDWLSAGVAGVALPRPEGSNPTSATAEATYTMLAARLRALLRSFPGERVLLAEMTSKDGNNAGATALHHSRSTSLFGSGQGGGELITTVKLPTHPPTAEAMRQSLATAAASHGPERTSLLRFAEDPATASPEAVAEAAFLLTSPGAAVFDFGNEIGLQTYTVGGAETVRSPVMQWTPANVQQATPAPIERATPGSTAGNEQYGPYRPYVHPPPVPLTGPIPAPPHAIVDGNIPAALPDPDSLPGFTMGTLPMPPVHGDTINVATEDRDPHSLLNAYRQLIALHHGNPTLRGGGEIVLNRDAQNAVVWVRQAPASSRTAADIVGAVNLGDAPIVLTLNGDLASLGIHTGSLRPLFRFAPGASAGALIGETTGELRLPPYAVFLGEVRHTGTPR